jgi:hypothetical protein
MPVIEGKYVSLSEEEIKEFLDQELIQEFGQTADLSKDSVFDTLSTMVARTLAENQEQALEYVHDSAFLDTATGKDLDRVVAIAGISRFAATKATGEVRFYRKPSSDPAPRDFIIQKGTVVSTRGRDQSAVTYETTEKVTLSKGSKEAYANVRAVYGGTDGNVGADQVVVMPTPPDGVERVTNPKPIGDPNYVNRNGVANAPGEPRETDQELRDRIRKIKAAGGNATVDAIVGTMLNDVGVKSVTVFENKTDNDRRPNGLPPASFELIIHGGDDTEIAQALLDTKAVTSWDYGGIHGNEVTRTVRAKSNQQAFDMSFSRPPEVNPELDIYLVVNDDYRGDDFAKDEAIKYIGGEVKSGDVFGGRDTGEDIVIDQLTDRLVDSDDYGIKGVADVTSYPAITNNSNGLDVIDVGGSEIARIASRNDIAIYTTQA